MVNYIELLGFTAAACGTASFIPQVIQIWKTRAVQSISLAMYCIYCTSLVLWTIYGVLINSPSLIAAQVVTFILAFSILVMKFLWK